MIARAAMPVFYGIVAREGFSAPKAPHCQASLETRPCPGSRTPPRSTPRVEPSRSPAFRPADTGRQCDWHLAPYAPPHRWHRRSPCTSSSTTYPLLGTLLAARKARQAEVPDTSSLDGWRVAPGLGRPAQLSGWPADEVAGTCPPLAHPWRPATACLRGPPRASPHSLPTSGS